MWYNILQVDYINLDFLPGVVTAIVVNLVTDVVATGVAVKINYKHLNYNMSKHTQLIEFHKLIKTKNTFLYYKMKSIILLITFSYTFLKNI